MLIIAPKKDSNFRADSVDRVAAAARPPLYHDLLRLPATELELQQLLRIDVAQNIRQERIARAG